MSARLEAGAATDVGRVRAANEDSYLVRDTVFAVADGMGGHAAGEVASELALRPLARIAEVGATAPEEVRRAVAEANAGILEDGEAHPEHRGMGTTLTALALVPVGGVEHWVLVNVGDSRAYRVTQSSVLQLTTDHSEVEELVAAGRITREQARSHPNRNVVTRCLGSAPAPTPDVWIFPAEAGDLFVLCSDGLSNELGDRQIGELARSASSPQDAADRLVAAAVEAGGHDNVTVVVVEWTP